jgi:hypothetical protein
LLLVDRARINAALQRWPEAEQDLDEFFRHLPAGKPVECAMACLVQGFLRERRGDAAGAQEAWRRGWRAVRGNEAMKAVPTTSWLLGSLANDLTDADVERMLATWSTIYAKNSSIVTAVRHGLAPLPLVTATLRNTWRSPRGRAYARRIAGKEMSRAENHRVEVCLFAAELIHQGAVTGELSPKQDALIWKLVQDLYAGYTSGGITEAQLLKAALAWTGTTGFLGWEGLAPTVAPSLRGPLAYVLGHRYLHLDQPAAAVVLFRTARDNATVDSALWSLARTELDRLKAH